MLAPSADIAYVSLCKHSPHPSIVTCLFKCRSEVALAAVTNTCSSEKKQRNKQFLSVDQDPYCFVSLSCAPADDVWFINRRPIFAPEAGVRKFIARNAAGQLQGYIFFDGVFEGGRLVGYYANVTRLLPDAHPGTLNLMMKTFLERCLGSLGRGAWGIATCL